MRRSSTRAWADIPLARLAISAKVIIRLAVLSFNAEAIIRLATVLLLVIPALVGLGRNLAAAGAPPRVHPRGVVETPEAERGEVRFTEGLIRGAGVIRGGVDTRG